ncbi:MAG: hypothetical protein IKY78_04990 [Clostridia bacterium]|nr:hypothetical protein [Clostridia bacterium]
MKKVIVNNTTDSLLVMEGSEKHYEIAPNSKQGIEIENVNEFRVFKRLSPSSKFCIGQFLSKETLRNIWIFGPTIIINLDSNVKIYNGIKQINVTEKKYHFFLFAIFSVLLFNDELADFNDYHKKADKNKLLIFALICMIPLFIISLILLIGCVFGITNDFSIESIFICFFCIIPTSIFLWLLKSIYNLIWIDNKLKNISDNSKLIKIYADYAYE